MSAEIDVRAYLASKGVQTIAANPPEVTAHCWFCSDGDPKGRGKLYVNTEDGWFNCKRCGESGGTTLLMRSLGDDPKNLTMLPGQDPTKRRLILEEATALGEDMLSRNDDVMLYLCNDRGLWPETIVAYRFGMVADGWSLVGGLKEHHVDDLKSTGLVYRDGPRAGKDFFYNHLLIPYRSRGTTVQMRGRTLDPHASGGKYMTGPGESVRLFNADALDGAEDVFICEGEFDTLVVQQALSQSNEDRVRRIAVVGIAGAGALPPNFESYFAGAKRVYIALDPDDTGKRGAVKIKELLGTRARIVEWPISVVEDGLTKYGVGKMDWSEYVNKCGATWRDIVALMGTASGKRLYTMREAGEQWRTAKSTGVGIKTGYAQLDATILPGILPGQVVVILAKTGTGKTILLCNLAVAMRSHKVLFISLEMTREEVYDRLRKIYLFHNPTATDEVLEYALSNVLICDENRLSDQDMELLIEEYVNEVGCKPEIVYVDYLGYYARGQKGSSAYEKTTNAVMQLKAVAKAHRCAIVAPHQVNRLAKEGKPMSMDDARDSGAVEETADFLLSIYRPDDALTAESQQGQQQSGRVKVSVLKSRHGGKGRTFTMIMDLLTLAIVDDTGPAAQRANEHNHMFWRGDTYERLRQLESAPRQLSLIGGTA